MSSTHIDTHLQGISANSSGQPQLAIFDMDRTLILGFSAVAMLRQYFSRGGPGASQAALDLLSDGRAYSGKQALTLYKRLASQLKGVAEADFTALGEATFEQYLAADIYSEARQLIAHHRSLGHHIIIISAATPYQVAPVARELGVEEYYCTQLRVTSGKFTGKIQMPLCQGEGKVIAARRAARRHGAKLAQSWFYSDSKDDLPLLRQVGFPVATNPSSALASYARAKGWDVLNCRSRSTLNTESVIRTGLLGGAMLGSALAGAGNWLQNRSSDQMANTISRSLASLGPATAGIDFEVNGLPYVDTSRPAVFAFNHQSYLDAIILAWLLKDNFVPMCKQELAGNPLIGPMLKSQGAIFVDRDAKDQSQCLKQALAVLKSGKSLAIAPEGTRSNTGKLGEFKHGAVYVARKAGVPLVPIIIHNAADALPKGKLWLNPTTVQISVLPPINPDQLGRVRQGSRKLETLYREELAFGWHPGVYASSTKESSSRTKLH